MRFRRRKNWGKAWVMGTKMNFFLGSLLQRVSTK
jgi:hypothetical protein